MRVEHFMTKNPVRCDINDSISTAAEQMKEKNVGCVVIIQNSKVAGIVTDRDLVVKGMADGVDGDSKISQIMTPNPARLTMEDNIFSAIDSFRSGGVVRRLPVVNAYNELVGLVSLSDIAPIAKDLIQAILLEEEHTPKREVHLMTGAQEITKRIRRPTKADRLMPELEVAPVTRPSRGGPTSKSGGTGRTPRARLATTPRNNTRSRGGPGRASRKRNTSARRTTRGRKAGRARAGRGGKRTVKARNR